MKLKIKLKNRDRISVGFEVVFKMRVLKHTTVYILFRLLFLKITHHDELKLKIKLTNRDRIRVGFELVFDLK